jgi:spoIIIJ-associated protein
MADEPTPQAPTPAGSDAEALTLAQSKLAEFLEQLNIKAEVAATWGDPDPDDQSRPLTLDVQGDDLSGLIGRNGETLDALQYLLRMMLGRQISPDVNLVVDVQGHKRRRAEQVRRMARRMAEQATQRNRTMVLEPMPAHERRLVHIELRDHPTVRTESVGEGNKRKVTIIPKNA